MATGAESWAASAANDDAPLPEPEETEPDADGIKTVTKYVRRPDGVVQKQISRVRVKSNVVKVSAAAVAREKRMKRFGQAVSNNTSNTTSFDLNLVKLRRPGDEDDRDKDVDEIIAQLKGGITTKKPEEDSAAGDSSAAASSAWARKMDRSEAQGIVGAAQAAAESLPQRFVPSAVANARASGGMSSTMSEYEETPALKISNLAETTTSEDLEEIFSEFGPISKANVVFDRETFRSRGYGFVNFYNREDAEMAKEELSKRKESIGGLVMSIEWSKKSRSMNTTFRTGYGGALPQS